MPVRIVTDSSCDLTEAETTELGVEVVPLSIRFGDEELQDRFELSVEDFYARMAAADRLPETAAPAPGQFEQAFAAQVAAGADAVICLTISEELSATIQSARTAAKAFTGAPVRVIDSKSITMGLGNLVISAAKAAAGGASADEVVALIEGRIPRGRVFGALDTLDNLKKGGRIGGAQAFLGSVLSIKPIVDISTGKVEEAAKQRTRKKSLQWLVDRIVADGAVEQLTIVHSNATDLDEFKALAAPTLDLTGVRYGMIGPVIGTHGGAGIMGACWVTPEG